MSLSEKEARRIGLIDKRGTPRKSLEVVETCSDMPTVAEVPLREPESAQGKQSSPTSRIAPPALKSRLTKPQKKMSYARACAAGWQFVFHHIGGGRVSCRAHNTRLGKTTDWLTDDTDGRGAVLAALVAIRVNEL
jgi:hypothetical protein